MVVLLLYSGLLSGERYEHIINLSEKVSKKIFFSVNFARQQVYSVNQLSVNLGGIFVENYLEHCCPQEHH
jgi:hypothetical protein